MQSAVDMYKFMYSNEGSMFCYHRRRRTNDGDRYTASRKVPRHSLSFAGGESDTKKGQRPLLHEASLHFVAPSISSQVSKSPIQ